MPVAHRQQPLWRQVASYFKERIASGELAQGDALPSMNEIAAEFGVSRSVAQRAVEHLHLAERLVRTDPTGTYVDVPRATVGPQQRLRLTAPAPGEAVTVTAAEVVRAPAYIVPLLGLPDGPLSSPDVVRREELVRGADGAPYMLRVTWCPVVWLAVAPELAQPVPLPDPRGAGPMIAERTGRDLGALSGGLALECREVLDDDREMAALQLGPGDYVLAGVHGWRDDDDVLEYSEWILPPGRVVEADVIAMT